MTADTAVPVAAPERAVRAAMRIALRHGHALSRGAAEEIRDAILACTAGPVRESRNPTGFRKWLLWEDEDGSSLRLHVWDDHVPDDTDIHQHRADFTSTVLHGSMNEELWRYKDEPGGGWVRMTVNCRTDETGAYHVDEHAPRVTCRVQPAELLTHKAGQTYDRPATDLHRVFPVALPLVTLVRFGPVYNQVHTMIRKREDRDG